MVELTFFGGVKEIGGNRILLEDNGTRVFLDFGLSFSLRKKYYDEFLQARSFAIIDEYVAFGLLPAVKGL
jgi:ribonuclease J